MEFFERPSLDIAVVKNSTGTSYFSFAAWGVVTSMLGPLLVARRIDFFVGSALANFFFKV